MQLPLERLSACIRDSEQLQGALILHLALGLRNIRHSLLSLCDFVGLFSFLLDQMIPFRYNVVDLQPLGRKRECHCKAGPPKDHTADGL